VIPPGWPTEARAAIALQRRLAAEVVCEDRLDGVATVAGVDAAMPLGRAEIQAAAVALRFPGLEPLAEATARGAAPFPYIPGLLSFRETPAVLIALARLGRAPDLILCDGHGLAHPRRFGLACHIGVLTDTPTIGIAKSRLVGTHDEPDETRGAWVPLTDGEAVIGAVLRTRAHVRPVYVSVGHRVSLASAIELVLACTPRYRLAEPIRAADRLSRRL